MLSQPPGSWTLGAGLRRLPPTPRHRLAGKELTPGAWRDPWLGRQGWGGRCEDTDTQRPSCPLRGPRPRCSRQSPFHVPWSRPWLRCPRCWGSSSISQATESPSRPRSHGGGPWCLHTHHHGFPPSAVREQAPYLKNATKIISPKDAKTQPAWWLTEEVAAKHPVSA